MAENHPVISKIYRVENNGRESFTLSYHAAGRRVLKMFASLDEAVAESKAKATTLANGELNAQHAPTREQIIEQLLARKFEFFGKPKPALDAVLYSKKNRREGKQFGLVTWVPLYLNAINVTNCVGQKVVFKLAFDLTLPSDVLGTNQNNWILPRRYVNTSTWFQSDFSAHGCGNYRISTCNTVLTWIDSGGLASAGQMGGGWTAIALHILSGCLDGKVT